MNGWTLILWLISLAFAIGWGIVWERQRWEDEWHEVKYYNDMKRVLGKEKYL